MRTRWRGTPDRHPRDRLRRELGLHDAMFLVVASVVGSGIFLTPGAIAERLPHPGLILAVWVVGGMLSLAGALANAELGAMFPHAGGDYVYLREAFHPLRRLPGRLALVLRRSSRAPSPRSRRASRRRSSRVLGLSGAGRDSRSRSSRSWPCSWLNAIGVRHGARANNVTGWIKVGVLAFFVMRGAAHRRAATSATCVPSSTGSSPRRRRWPSRSRSRPCSSATSAGTPRCTSRARSTIRGATCRARCSSVSGSASRSTSRSTGVPVRGAGRRSLRARRTPASSPPR